MKKSTKSMLPTLAAPVSRTITATADTAKNAENRGVDAHFEPLPSEYFPFAGDSEE